MKKTDALQIDLNMGHLILCVFIFCLVAEAIIIVLDILMNLAELWYLEEFKQLSNVAMEKSFGTWFSVVQNFMVAITALMISFHHRFISAQKSTFLGWLLVALFFAYISLDDHLVLHERISGTLGPLFFNWLFGKMITPPTYEWIFLMLPFFGAFGVFFLIFLYRQLEVKKYRLILISGLSLWSLAVLLDAWDGMSHAYDWVVTITGFGELHIRHAFILIEEAFEMLGSTLFLTLFLFQIRRLYTGRQTCFKLSE